MLATGECEVFVSKRNTAGYDKPLLSCSIQNLRLWEVDLFLMISI